MSTTLDHCPNHPEVEPELGYGLAGGGIGPYLYCPVCGFVIEKWQDPHEPDPPGTGDK